MILALHLPVMAQRGSGKADALLDKVVASIKADAPVRMDYLYKVCDDDGTLVQSDKGVLYVDGQNYALLMDKMKVWCNGTIQWSYMSDVNEIYITDAVSDEAQNLSPLSIVENYRKGYKLSSTDKSSDVLLTLKAPSKGADVDKVELYVRKSDSRLARLVVYMSGQGCVDVSLAGYMPHCGVGQDVFECRLKEYPTAEVVDMR